MGRAAERSATGRNPPRQVAAGSPSLHAEAGGAPAGGDRGLHARGGAVGALHGAARPAFSAITAWAASRAGCGRRATRRPTRECRRAIRWSPRRPRGASSCSRALPALLDLRLVRDGRVMALWVPTGLSPTDQLALVRADLGLSLRTPRCMACGGALLAAAKQEVKERIPPRTARWKDEYWVCGTCTRLFWQGTHWERIARVLGAGGRVRLRTLAPNVALALLRARSSSAASSSSPALREARSRGGAGRGLHLGLAREDGGRLLRHPLRGRSDGRPGRRSTAMAFATGPIPSRSRRAAIASSPSATVSPSAPGSSPREPIPRSWSESFGARVAASR